MKQIFRIVSTLGFLIVFSTIAKGEPLLNNPHTYIFETSGGTGSIDPAINYVSFGSGINDLIYETLVDYAGTLAEDVEGKLAIDWTISSDGLHYTFNLREDVTFHDGTPFNATAVKFSFDRLQYFINASGTLPINTTTAIMDVLYKFLNGTPIINRTEILNNYSVRFVLNAPYGPFQSLLCYESSYIISPYSTPQYNYINKSAGFIAISSSKLLSDNPNL